MWGCKRFFLMEGHRVSVFLEIISKTVYRLSCSSISSNDAVWKPLISKAVWIIITRSFYNVVLYFHFRAAALCLFLLGCEVVLFWNFCIFNRQTLCQKMDWTHDYIVCRNFLALFLRKCIIWFLQNILCNLFHMHFDYWWFWVLWRMINYNHVL